MPPSGETAPVDLVPGTLELIVLRTLTLMGPQHAYGIAARLEQLAAGRLRLNQGTLYPALVRLEQRNWIRGRWRTTENNREAKYYAITKSGTRALAARMERWERSAAFVNSLVAAETD